MDCSPPDPLPLGFFKPRILEWVAISFSKAFSWPRDRTQVSCIAGRCFTIWVTTADTTAAKLLQSCLTLCDPIDGSPPGSPIAGILQARILEWVAMSFSSAWKWKVKVKSLSRVLLLATSWTAAHQAPPSMGFSSNYSGPQITFFKKPKKIICLGCILACMHAKSLQSCPTLWDPKDYDPSGSSVHGFSRQGS